jgi:HAD superfamily hydrolase (TIGR01509 family)
MTKIKAVIFDMDGVLIEAKDWHYTALNKALNIFGMSISRYDHLVTYDGLPTRKKLEMISVERHLSRKLHSFINELKQQFTMEIVNASCKPRFYHEYALSKLRNDGYRLAVASNAVRNSVDTMLEKSALIEYIEFSLSNQDVKNSKPDPEMYIKAIKRLDLKPKECMIIEDNEKGIFAAKGSGANVMEVDTVEDVNYQNIIKHIKIFEHE